jgi:hypothetical protein
MFNNTGNKYAQKWTPEKVKESLDRIEDDAKNEETFYLGTALMHLRITRKVWSYWRKKFADDEDIIEHMDLIDQIFEVKLVDGGRKGELPTAAAIFMLKNNHQWTDKPQSEQQLIELPQHREPSIVYELTNQRALIVPYPSQSVLTEKGR